MKIIIINDNTKRLKHWQLKNPGADILTFTHPNYVIEEAKGLLALLSHFNEGK